MKDWDLWVAVMICLGAVFFFGMWIQKTVDQWQLQKFEQQSWLDGCKRCAQFEKDSCERNQLQGVSEYPQIKLKRTK